MKKLIVPIAAIIITGLYACGKSIAGSNSAQVVTPAVSFYDEYAAKSLPAAPAGKKWIVDSGYTDEFKGSELDFNKWTNQLSTWKGRAPGYFVAGNVSVANDKLVLKNNWLSTPIISGADTFYIGCAAVGSKNSSLIFPVYTETRMKASDVSLSSTFWMVTDASVKYPNTANCQFSYGTEMDIIETTGGAYTWDTEIQAFNTQLKSNSHFRTRPCAGGAETFYSKSVPSKNLGFTTNADYHTYGCYWIDASHCKMYVDGVEFYTITFDASLKSNPFDLPMGLRMVTETYNWLKYPTQAMLQDDTKNTTYYDWVRTYKLVEK